MPKKVISQILSEWSEEFADSLNRSNSLIVALFSSDRELLFATPDMYSLLKGEPSQSFINPTFDQLLAIDSSVSLIYEGLLTIGDYSSINTTIVSRVFRRENHLLVIGGIDSMQLIVQNATMHHLNRQINNLQRDLIKEKLTLQNTLSQLNDVNISLKNTNITKDKFFSIIAHDLRSPFNNFLGLTQLMVDELPDLSMDDIHEIAVNMKNNATDLFRLLENLLQWSRMQQGLIPFEPEMLKLQTLVDESMSLAMETARIKGIELTVRIPDQLTVFADSNMLQTIFRNLLSNALKFTKRGGKISLDAMIAHDKSVEMSIRDSGIGMSSEIINHLFRIENQINRRGTQGEPSSGLGLLLCREFVEKHGGSIYAESEKDKGSVFHFKIPSNKEK